MSISNLDSEKRGNFRSRIPGSVAANGPVAELLLKEYGAVFITSAVPPPEIIFPDENAVADFQASVATASACLAGFDLALQQPAMESLLNARKEARDLGLDITPRGADSAARTYADTVGLWGSRVEPALDHWVGAGRILPADAALIRSLPPFEQVPLVLALEREGIYFSRDLSKSIIYSVAPPGTSQHLSLLAFDVKEFGDPTVCSILAKNGWFQTVVSDLPHFTYLGRPEFELAASGLKRFESNERTFWIPDL